MNAPISATDALRLNRWLTATINEGEAYRKTYTGFLQGLFDAGLRGYTKPLGVRIFNTLPTHCRSPLISSQNGQCYHIKDACLNALFSYYIQHYLEGEGLSPETETTQPDTQPDTQQKDMSKIIDAYTTTPIANPTLVFGRDLDKSSERDLQDLIVFINSKIVTAEDLLKKAPTSTKIKARVTELRATLDVVVREYDKK